MTDLTITTAGRQLIADMLAGTETATFTKIQTSSHDYTGVTLTGLTSLSDVEQTQDVSMVTRIDAATVQVLASINNESLASAYYIKAIGLFAEDSESNEILFAVATDIANPHYMPLPSEYVTGITYKLNVTVDNAGAVTIVIDPAAAPTMAQVVTLSTKIDQVTDMVGTVEPTNTATSAHAVGEYFINSDGQLVKTTAAIAVGNTIATGTNTARTTIAEVMAQANAAISQLNSEKAIIINDTAEFETSADFVYTGYSLSIPAKSCFSLNIFAGYQLSRPLEVGVSTRLDPTYAAHWIVPQHSGCNNYVCGYTENGFTAYLFAKYNYSANNKLGAQGYIISKG